MTYNVPGDENLRRELGSFDTITFDFSVGGGDEARTYFHEFVHLLQALGSTYCIDQHLETMNYIAAFVADMGGHSELVLSGASDAAVTRDNIMDHIRLRRESFEGAYGSRRVDLGVTLDKGAETVGMLRLNKESICWEYIRWNRAERCFYATPIGARTLRETHAHLLHHLVEIEPDAKVAIAYGTGAADSAAHVYTALPELFFRMFTEPKVSQEDKFATLVVLIDMALQIPSISYRAHPDWVPMTTPGHRFVTFIRHVRDVGFVDHGNDADYGRFMEDMCTLLGWPTPLVAWEEFLQGVRRTLEPIRRFVHASIEENPAAFERYLDDRLAKLTDRDAAPTIEVEDIKAMFRENPLSYSGFLGVGILDAIERAMELRLHQPMAFTFPQQQRFLDVLHPLFKPRVIRRGREIVTDLQPVALPLLEDMQGIRHLWAMTLQWADGRRRDLKCGNQFFGRTCPDPPCRRRLCPTWNPGTVYPTTACTYADVIEYFRLGNVGSG